MRLKLIEVLVRVLVHVIAKINVIKVNIYRALGVFTYNADLHMRLRAHNLSLEGFSMSET